VKLYVLDLAHRKDFKHPYGILIRSKNAFKEEFLIKALRSASKTAFVGDYVTVNALSESIIPTIALIDGKTRRHDPISYNKIIKEFKKVYEVVNPPGTISEQAVLILEKIIYNNEERVLIVVEGEEDLLVLPLITLLPLNSVIVYGQPGSGAVLLIVDDLLKKISLNLSLYFKPHIAYVKEV